MADEPVEKKYEDYKENEYVESLGGRDLLSPVDNTEPLNEKSPYNDPNSLDFIDTSQQRRMASLTTAQSLGLTSVSDLLDAAEKIEKFIKGEKS